MEHGRLTACLRTIPPVATSIPRNVKGNLGVRARLLLRRTARLAVIVPFAALLHSPSPASAQVSQGAAEDFAVLGGSAVTCTNSTVEGDAGVDLGGAFTQTNCTISGTVHVGDAVAQQAYDDFLDAYDDLATVPPCDFTNEPLDNTNASLMPGVYCFDAAVTQTGTTWTLDGSCTDTWIFRIGTLGTGALTGTNFTVVNPGCEACADNNVFWWTAEAATLTDSNFLGSILAGTSITATRGSFNGQALAKAAVTLTGASPLRPPPATTGPIPRKGDGRRPDPGARPRLQRPGHLRLQCEGKSRTARRPDTSTTSTT